MILEYAYKDNPNNELTSFELPKGTWLFRIWGAQGGYINDTNGGRGAYSEGIYIANKNTTLYYFIGEKGKCSNTNLKSKIKFSGGNNRIGELNDSSCIGGEATFISKDPEAMKILLISGSGGGSGSHRGIEFVGGYGGPFAGDSIGSAYNIEKEDAKRVRGKGATVSRPGEGGYYSGDGVKPPISAQNGEYLKGGNANVSAYAAAGGGGAGYYGGGGGADLAGGGGGSSFASYELYNVILLGGDKIFMSEKNQTEIGHQGNGFIRIEETDPFTIDKMNFIKCTNENVIYSCISYNIIFILTSQIFMGFS